MGTEPGYSGFLYVSFNFSIDAVFSARKSSIVTSFSSSTLADASICSSVKVHTFLFITGSLASTRTKINRSRVCCPTIRRQGKDLVGMLGFEPRYRDPKSPVLPLDDIPTMGRATGFEPVIREPQSLVLPLHHARHRTNGFYLR